MKSCCSPPRTSATTYGDSREAEAPTCDFGTDQVSCLHMKTDDDTKDEPNGLSDAVVKAGSQSA